jgi:hypothetical protein
MHPKNLQVPSGNIIKTFILKTDSLLFIFKNQFQVAVCTIKEKEKKNTKLFSSLNP